MDKEPINSKIFYVYCYNFDKFHSTYALTYRSQFHQIHLCSCYIYYKLMLLSHMYHLHIDDHFHKGIALTLREKAQEFLKFVFFKAQCISLCEQCGFSLRWSH